MKRGLALLGLCVVGSCVLPDVPIVDSLASGGNIGGAAGSSAVLCPTDMPAPVDSCDGIPAGTVCYWFPVGCTCQPSLTWVCTGCEQDAPCAMAGQACSGADGQCVCQSQTWDCAGTGSGGNGGSGGSTGGNGGASGSAGSAGSGGAAGSGGGVSTECTTYCNGPTGILDHCADHVPEWTDETVCAEACAAHEDSLACWQMHLGYILEGGPKEVHCVHATGAPGNGTCDER